MKIAVIAWRHWSAGRRYRSLMLNAKRLGHQVWGFAANHLGDVELTLAAFGELGIEAWPEAEFHKQIDRLNPDVTFGEWNHPSVKLEIWAQEWVSAHNKVGFFINHRPYAHQVAFGYEPCFGRAHFLVSNQGQLNAAMQVQFGWPHERIHLLGVPDLDFITETVNIPSIRNRLGVVPGQPLIGMFSDPEFNPMNLMQLANQHAWKVVIHLHPQERRRQNWGDFNGGFYYQQSRQGVWKEPQDMGATFIADYAPGTIGSIPFQPCRVYELMLAADCLVTWDSADVVWEAYALGRRCHIDAARIREWARHTGYLADFMDLSLEEQDLGSKILQTVQRGSNSIEQNPAIVEKYFWKLDGLWWQRALDLARQLTGA